MAVTAKLTIRLLAEEVVVAESDDAKLWQRVLAAMNGSGQPLGGAGDEELEHRDLPPGRGKGSRSIRPGQGVEGLAAELGVSVEEVEGACSPSSDAPYLHMDSHCWEALKNNTPTRGPGAVAPITLAATILALWFGHAGIPGLPTQKQCQDALATMNLRDTNPSRAIRRCEWLKPNGSAVGINPAYRSKAVRIAAAFCSKKPPGGEGGE
jgi:hypothetical protein